MKPGLPSVDFTVTEEQTELSDLLRSFFLHRRRPHYAEEEVTLDRAGMQSLGAELGVLGLDIPEAVGGAGAGPVEALMLDLEAGRELSDLPILATDAACHLLASSGDELLKPVLRGELVVSVAGLTTGSLVASRNSGSVRVDGTCRVVFGNSGSDATLVLADLDNHGIVVLAVETPASGQPASGHTVARAESFDLSREWTIHSFDSTPARIVIDQTLAGDLLPSIRNRVRVAVAADQVGIASAMMVTALEYAKIRYQFGRAIGSQQAIKHRLVDMSIFVERARSALEYYGRCGAEVRGVGALLSLVCANQTAQEVCKGAIQVLGGLGMTWQHPAHRYLRRAVVNRAIFPTARRELSNALWSGFDA